MDLDGRRVLLIGDSHLASSRFGVELTARLRARGAQVTNRAVGGSSARSWTSGGPVCRPGTSEGCERLDEVVRAGPWHVVLVSLGTNDAANAHAEGTDPARAAERTVARLLELERALAPAQVWFIGPPRMGRTSGHYTDATMRPVADAMARSLGRYVDSRAVAHVDGDGVHVGPEGARRWADATMRRLDAVGSAGGAQALVGVGVAVGALVLWRALR